MSSKTSNYCKLGNNVIILTQNNKPVTESHCHCSSFFFASFFLLLFLSSLLFLIFFFLIFLLYFCGFNKPNHTLQWSLEPKKHTWFVWFLWSSLSLFLVFFSFFCFFVSFFLGRFCFFFLLLSHFFPSVSPYPSFSFFPTLFSLLLLFFLITYTFRKVDTRRDCE